MNPFLASLLGQQSAAPMAGGVFNSEDPNENEILLQGAPPPRLPPQPEQVTLQQQDGPDNFIMGNARPVAMAREAEKDSRLNSERKGMFGVGGTLRDVLGFLGDSYLVSQGKGPAYQARRQQEKWADALQGFSQGGDAERSAIERAMRIDPEATTEFLKQQQMNQSNMGNLELRGQEFGLKIEDAAMTRAGQIMAAAVSKGDPALIEQAKQAIGVLSQQTGIPVERLMAGGDPRLIAGREATANQNLRLPLEERRVATGEGQLAVAMRNAKTREQQLKLARDIFGMRLNDQQFDQLMSWIKLPGEIEESYRDNNKSERPAALGNPQAPATNRFRPATRQ